MTTCNARTDELGNNVGVISIVNPRTVRLADIVSKTPEGDGLIFRPYKIGDLLNVKASPLPILLNFVMRQYNLHAGVKVRYAFQKRRHYVKIRGRIWTCFNGQVKRHLVK